MMLHLEVGATMLVPYFFIEVKNAKIDSVTYFVFRSICFEFVFE